MENLWWMTTDPKWTEGLKEKLQDKEVFITIRFGDKWFHKVKPWDKVKISVTDDPADPTQTFLGEAKVLVTNKGTIGELRAAGNATLEKNIGAKNWDQAKADIQKVYSHENVTEDSIITIIELHGV